jgi:hypothetical protein
VITADNLDAAIARAQGCPILLSDGSIEDGEAIKM